MKRWEYQVISRAVEEIERNLNRLGKKGWKVIPVGITGHLILERVIPKSPKPKHRGY